MGLRKSKGNMYPWVTHTHAALGGECPHKCPYCYVDNPRWGRAPKYQGNLRLIVSEMATNLGSGRTIFKENCNDLFAADGVLICAVLEHCRKYPDNIYVFQTKNPRRMWDFRDAFPPRTILGTTIETNRTVKGSHAPNPADRVAPMERLPSPKFVTVEPILDFDVAVLLGWIKKITPTFVNIGADSKGHGLPEPSPDKINALIVGIQQAGIEIREKHNLGRLLRES